MNIKVISINAFPTEEEQQGSHQLGVLATHNGFFIYIFYYINLGA